MRVLVVDDVPEIGKLLHLLLTAEGHATSMVARDFGQLLADDYPWQRVDVAICDLNLGASPVTGTDLLLYIGRVAPHVRRVAFSAAGHGALVEAGDVADVVLRKGELDIDEVVAAITGIPQT